MDENSHCQQGVIHAAFWLLSSLDMSAVERTELVDAIEWFNWHLPYPSREQRRILSHRAIFWFRPTARDCIQKAWKLAQLLRSHGLLVDELKSHDPGNVVFGDKFQVAAVLRS